MAREKELDGVEMHHMLSQSFNGTPKIVWDKKAKKISKRAKKWQGKIDRYKKEVEPMMRYMAQRVNEMYEEYKEYQRRNNYDKGADNTACAGLPQTPLLQGGGHDR